MSKKDLYSQNESFLREFLRANAKTLWIFSSHIPLTDSLDSTFNLNIQSGNLVLRTYTDIWLLNAKSNIKLTICAFKQHYWLPLKFISVLSGFTECKMWITLSDFATLGEGHVRFPPFPASARLSWLAAGCGFICNGQIWVWYLFYFSNLAKTSKCGLFLE